MFCDIYLFSMFTNPLNAFGIQVIFCVIPACQISLPLGKVSVIEEKGLIVKLASDLSLGEPVDASLIRMRQRVLSVLGTITSSEPSFTVLLIATQTSHTWGQETLI